MRTTRPGNPTAARVQTDGTTKRSASGRLLRPVERGPDAVGAVPAAARGALRIFGRALLEEIGVLDAVQDLDQPRQRMRLHLAIAALDPLEIAHGRVELQLG